MRVEPFLRASRHASRQDSWYGLRTTGLRVALLYHRLLETNRRRGRQRHGMEQARMTLGLACRSLFNGNTHTRLLFRSRKSLDSVSITTESIICSEPCRCDTGKITTGSIAGSRIACKVNDSTMRLIRCKMSVTYTLSQSLPVRRERHVRNHIR